MWFAKYFLVESRQELPAELAFEQRDWGIGVYTHALRIASKTHTLPASQLFCHSGWNLGSMVLFSSAHHDSLSWCFNKSQKILVLWHSIIAMGRSAVHASSIGARNWAMLLRPWQQRCKGQYWQAPNWLYLSLWGNSSRRLSLWPLS